MANTPAPMTQKQKIGTAVGGVGGLVMLCSGISQMTGHRLPGGNIWLYGGIALTVVGLWLQGLLTKKL